MDVPAHEDDVQASALTPGDRLGYLHHADGSWSVIGPDGWPLELEGDIHEPAVTRPIGLGLGIWSYRGVGYRTKVR